MAKNPLTVTKLRLVFTITIAFLSFYGSAQSGYWEKETAQNNTSSLSLARLNVKKASVFSFNENLFKDALKGSSLSGKIGKQVFFPDETGKLIAFKVTEASVMAPALAAKFPEIKSYVGYSLDGDIQKVRFSVSPNGIQSMIVNANDQGNIYMQKAQDNKYVVYKRKSNTASDKGFLCEMMAMVEKNGAQLTMRPVDGQVLRKFRLAISATGEYTTFHGGTVNDAMAAINASVTRLNQIFENDLAVTLELVANNDEVIFTDATTDPYSGNLNAEVQNTLDSTIGNDNYDVGHLFNQEDDVFSGNAGFIAAVCSDNRKGSGFSTSGSPSGDLFDIDLVAHEIGHQFGANHTWSFESEGTQVQFEPGSGSTIMGYAGITGANNVTGNSDDYFHYVSIVQISDYLETVSCAQITSLANNPPVVVSPLSFSIPKSTAFALTGSATDVDPGDVLTYAWEQIDDGIVTNATFGPNNPNGANFRSQIPSTDPTRYFPALDRVILGELTQTGPTIDSAWETVSDEQRDLNFALSVRDNALGGGQVVSEEMRISVLNSAGPFTVISQSTNEILTTGEVQTVTWDVANTNSAPINATIVDIFLSIDGGLTFPIVLADDTPNDGSHDIVVPGNPSTAARIMIKASNNVFFAVNEVAFTIVASEIVLNFDTLEYAVCQPNNISVQFDYETYLGFNGTSTFSTVNLPTGLNVAFTPSSASSDTQVNVVFSNTAAVAENVYAIDIVATSGSITKQVTLQLAINDSDFADVTLISPVDGATEVSAGTVLEWESDPSYTFYDVQIATDAGFGNIIETANVYSNSFSPINLQNGLTYFWRVRPQNSCGNGTFGAAFSFNTIEANCENYIASGLPMEISDNGTPTVTATIPFYQDLVVNDINVNIEIDHTWLADLAISLTSPSGTTVVLVSNSCGNLQNINAVFDDSANNFVCGGTPGISGTVKPLGALSSFNGESTLGEWTLQIMDNANADGGALIGFSLEVCVEGTIRPDNDNDGIFDDGDDLCLGTPEGVEVDSDGCQVFRLPNDNFLITLQSEACHNSNDGLIQVDVMQSLNYEISITGNNTNVTENFTDTYTLTGLSAGTYSVCINATDGTNDYVEYCFEVVITEPDPLSVSLKTSLDGSQVDVDLQGASLYFIELNGKSIQTSQDHITLDLKNGNNSLKISTDMPCQGIFEENYFFSDRPIVYPNPFSDYLNVFLSSGLNEITISVYGLNGQLILSDIYRASEKVLELDFTTLSSGTYFVKFEGVNVNATSKVIKK